jgi:hypothetical protein
MKHTVATCAHLLAAQQWRLVHAELDAGAELEVTTADKRMDRVKALCLVLVISDNA